MNPSFSRLTFVLCAVICVSAAAQEVTLPLDRYERLRKEAEPRLAETPEPAVPVTLDRAWLEIEATADGARLTQELTVTILGDGWQEISLPRSGSYLSAEMGGLEGRLSDGRLIVRGGGRHEITLQSMVRLTVDDSSARPLWSLSVPLPEAAVVAGVVRTPAAISESMVISGGVAREVSADGSLLFAGFPGQNMIINMLGARRGPEYSALPLRFAATSATLVRLSQTRHRLGAELAVQVFQGEMNELRVRIPESCEVVDAEGELLAGWDVDGDELVLRLVDPVHTAFDVRVDLSGPPGDSVVSPLLIPMRAERVTYASGLSVEGDGLLELVDQGSARFAGAGEGSWIPPEWKRQRVATMVVADHESPPSWKLEWAHRSDVLAAQADRMVVDVLAGSGGRAAYQVWLAVRSSGAAVLRIRMPMGLQLSTASRDGIAVVPGQDGTSLVFPLAARSEVQVIHLAALVLMTVPEQGRLEIPLPALSAPVSRVEARVSLPSGIRCSIEPASRAGRVSSPPQAAPPGGSDPLAQVITLKRSRPGGGAGYGFFPTPPSFTTVEAAWSAMVPDPAPVTIDVSPDHARKEWF